MTKTELYSGVFRDIKSEPDVPLYLYPIMKQSDDWYWLLTTRMSLRESFKEIVPNILHGKGVGLIAPLHLQRFYDLERDGRFHRMPGSSINANQRGWLFRPHLFFKKEIHEKMDIFKYNGLNLKWHSDAVRLHRSIHGFELEFTQMDNLFRLREMIAVLQMWALGIGIGCLAFVVELFRHKFF